MMKLIGILAFSSFNRRKVELICLRTGVFSLRIAFAICQTQKFTFTVASTSKILYNDIYSITTNVGNFFFSVIFILFAKQLSR